MRLLTMQPPEVVGQGDIAVGVIFEVSPQGSALISEQDNAELNRLCQEIRSRLREPVMLSLIPHRVGRRNCLAIHLSGQDEKTLDVLVTITGFSGWPDEAVYVHGIRWYVSVTDAIDMLWLLKQIARITAPEGSVF